MPEERLQKILARAGKGSRRACEVFIAEARVTVNGKTAVLGTKADAAKDHISLDGKLIPRAEPLVYIALHKPRRVISAVASRDERPTVIDLVDVPERIYPVGRLDFDSEGLILLTNDGELANQLTHPRYGHEKEYRVRVGSKPDLKQLEILRRGVVLEDGYRTAPATVTVESSTPKATWLRMVLREGRKRQIREMGARIGLSVSRIIRVRIGALALGSLKRREWRQLTPGEVVALKRQPKQKRRRSKRKPR